jgi:hypothetical protein
MRRRGADQQHLVVEADSVRRGIAEIGNTLCLESQRPILPFGVLQQGQAEQIGGALWPVLSE